MKGVSGSYPVVHDLDDVRAPQLSRCLRFEPKAPHHVRGIGNGRVDTP